MLSQPATDEHSSSFCETRDPHSLETAGIDLAEMLDVEAWRARVRAETLSNYSIEMGLAIEREGGPDVAVQHYRNALAANPDCLEAQTRIAERLHANGDASWEEVDRQFRLLNPHYASLGRLRLGVRLLRATRYEEALECFASAGGEPSRFEEASGWRVVTQSLADPSYVPIIDGWEKLSRTIDDPAAFAEFLHACSEQALSKGRTVLATNLLTVALLFSDDNVRALKACADEQVKNGAIDDAVGLYERIIQAPHCSQNDYRHAAFSLRRLRKPDLAEAAFVAGVKRFPGNVFLCMDYGALLLQRGRPEAAVAMFGQAITLASDNPAPHALKGVALQALGHAADAAVEYGIAEKVGAGASVWKSFSILGIGAQDRWAEALDRHRSLLQSDLRNLWIVLHMGVSAMHAGDRSAFQEFLSHIRQHDHYDVLDAVAILEAMAPGLFETARNALSTIA